METADAPPTLAGLQLLISDMNLNLLLERRLLFQVQLLEKLRDTPSFLPKVNVLRDRLLDRMREAVERAAKQDRISAKDAKYLAEYLAALQSSS